MRFRGALAPGRVEAIAKARAALLSRAGNEYESLLAEIGLAWAPLRSIAAWYLWRASEEGKRLKQSTSRA